MLVLKCLLPFLIVCLINGAHCKPTDNDLTQGRGIGSTVWGWITYPFSWWGSDDIEAPPEHDHLIASTIGPYDNVQIASRNVTIWCNDDTCTTMKCEKTACVNVTCSIYDTDVTGQCREYNTGLKPEEPKPSLPTEPIPIVDAAVTPKVSSTTPIASQSKEPAEEHPIELEAVINKGNPELPAEDKVNKSSPQNKI